MIALIRRREFITLLGGAAGYKRNQVEEAIFRTLGARDARLNELKFRIKRLLVTVEEGRGSPLRIF